MNAHNPSSEINEEEIFSLLANRYCRYVLVYFYTYSDNRATLEEIADWICNQPIVSDHDKIIIQLHHSALPRLADTGVIEYDTKSHIVRYQNNPALEKVLKSTLEE